MPINATLVKRLHLTQSLLLMLVRIAINGRLRLCLTAPTRCGNYARIKTAPKGGFFSLTRASIFWRKRNWLAVMPRFFARQHVPHRAQPGANLAYLRF